MSDHTPPFRHLNPSGEPVAAMSPCPECGRALLPVVLAELVRDEVEWIHPQLEPGESPDALLWFRCEGCPTVVAESGWTPL